jgi:hypothetical protein
MFSSSNQSLQGALRQKKSRREKFEKHTRRRHMEVVLARLMCDWFHCLMVSRWRRRRRRRCHIWRNSKTPSWRLTIAFTRFSRLFFAVSAGSACASIAHAHGPAAVTCECERAQLLVERALADVSFERRELFCDYFLSQFIAALSNIFCFNKVFPPSRHVLPPLPIKSSSAHVNQPHTISNLYEQPQTY